MKILLNGKETELAAETSILGLVEGLKISLEAAAVELNQEIVTRDKRDKAILKEGDKVEIIKIIGGG